MKPFGMKTLGALLLLLTALLAGIGVYQAAEVRAAALTADRNTELKFGVDIKSYPVAATTDIFGGSLVCLTTAGYATPCTDTANYIAVGIAEARADNNPGSAGDISVRVRAGIAKLNATAITQAMVGSQMYVVDDNTVDDSIGTNSISVGPLLEFVSATSGWVWVGPQANVKQASGVAAGYRIARGATALDGSNPTPVATGLTAIVSCTATINATAAPGLSTSVITTEFATAGTMNLYGWKVTGAGDTTLIASTGTDTIAWVCIGK